MKTNKDVLINVKILIAALSFVNSDIGSGPILVNLLYFAIIWHPCHTGGKKSNKNHWKSKQCFCSLQIYYCKEDEVCLYKSLLFEVPFREGVFDTAKADVTLAHFVKPKNPTNSLLQPIAP